MVTAASMPAKTTAGTGAAADLQVQLEVVKLVYGFLEVGS